MAEEKSKNYQDVIRKFLEELSEDIVEERVVKYIIREVHRDRSLKKVLDDPYVRNRLNEEEVTNVLERPEIIEAVEAELNRSFKQKDFKFDEI